MCAIEGCDRAVLARGWCTTHYYRWRRHGDPTRTVKAVGMVRLDAAPMVAAVEASGRAPFALYDDTERRAYSRAKRKGWVNDQHAERLLAAVGRTLDDTYGPSWDEVAA